MNFKFISITSQLSFGYRYLTLFLVLSLLIVTNVQAKQSIAKVISVKGDVYAQSENKQRKLKRRSKVFKDDIISTGKDAGIQLRFTDGALMVLEDESQLTISEYAFNDNKNDQVLFELLEGKLRTITGKIGKKNKKNYQMKTPVATIGIRGTHYVLNYCQSNCAQKFSDRVKQGLYGGVYQGSISTKNGSGTANIRKDDYFYVQSSNQAPQMLLHVPEPLQTGGILNSGKNKPQKDRNASNEKAKDEEGDTTGDSSGQTNGSPNTKQSSTAGNPPPNKQNSSSTADGQAMGGLLLNVPPNIGGDTTGGVNEVPVTQADANTTTIVNTVVNALSGFHTSSLINIHNAPVGTAGGVALSFVNFQGTLDGVAEFVDAGNNGIVTRGEFASGPANVIIKLEDSTQNCLPICSVKAENAFLLDDGGDALGINWGRWSGEINVEENGVLTKTNTNMHYVNVGNVTPLASVPMTGVFTFNYVGGTKPTSNTGNVGSILPGTKMVFDFGSSNINAFINVGINGKVLNASGSSTFSGAGKADIQLGGTCTGCSNSALLGGNLQTVLVGANAEGAAGPFNIRSSDSTVSGVIYTKK
ncbi:MAG: FecR domain-containing protein [Gammaproteobacteria bacterium]|nr:FecR domain-containing protein [Gammaproteobacteria bacterium]